MKAPARRRGVFVTATSPEGSTFTFVSISEAARMTGCSPYYVWAYVNGYAIRENGWVFRNADDSAKISTPSQLSVLNAEAAAALPPEKETESPRERIDTALLVISGQRRPDPDEALAAGARIGELPVVRTRATDTQLMRVDDMREYEEAERIRNHIAAIKAGPHRIGYHISDMPSICPVCGKLLVMNMKPSKKAKGVPEVAREHLERCLEGHDYEYIPGGQIIVAV